MKIRDERTKKAFIKYLEDNPTQRFWQAIRNFSNFSFIYGSHTLYDDQELTDTFYIESDQKGGKDEQ